MAKRPDVLVSLTQDVAKILTCIHGVKIEGESNLLTSLQIAKLCLKHRANKHQRQRVIAFVGKIRLYIYIYVYIKLTGELWLITYPK